MNEKYLEGTKILRNALVSRPLEENEIALGMKVLYASGQPSGIVTIDVANVGEIIEGILSDGLKGFRGISSSGKKGIYQFGLDYRLGLVSSSLNDIYTVVYDQEKAISHIPEVCAEYSDQLFTFAWKDPYAGEPEKLGLYKKDDTNRGLFMIAKRDPLRMRVSIPGKRIAADENTQFFNLLEGYYWFLQQKIPDGPLGNFSLPGYRELSEGDYFELIEALD